MGWGGAGWVRFVGMRNLGFVPTVSASCSTGTYPNQPSGM